ncbi:hypothetical protein EBZ38_08420 [bacterium]|nr:hypothetical protein [bacterium]
MLPKKMSFNKQDAQDWEKDLIQLAEAAEEIGKYETARMFFACAAIMHDFAEKLKKPDVLLS